jgi:riboflavin kinase/FMN adenylyltransferase
MCATARRGLAVGFFDGVHRGHQAILAHAAAALTFRNHPLAVLAPADAPHLLMSCAERLAAIRACGVGGVQALDFTAVLAATPPEEFVRTVLAPACPDRVVLCGANWRFGRGGTGDAAFLRRSGFTVEVVPFASHAGGRISSTRIRAALESGAVSDAAAMLGRPWRVRGETGAGKGLGAAIGFPTLNVRLNDVQIALPRGVYAVDALGARALANFGVAPTLGARAWPAPILEIHFPHGLPAGVGAPPAALDVDFLRFVRPERKFSSIEELKRQIARDCAIINA